MKFLNANSIKIESDVSEIDEILEKEEMLYAISESIIKYRKNNNLNQKELAEKLGVNQTMISKLESGTYNPTFIKIQRMCRKLTNSPEMFIEILEEIKNAIRRVTKKNYIVDTNKNQQYVYNEKNNVIEMRKYKSGKIIKNGESVYGEYKSEITAIG